MRVRARLFAATRDAVGASSVDVELPAGARVADLVDVLQTRHPRLAPYRAHLLIGLDEELVMESAPLREGAEVALMPPVSGGSGAASGESAKPVRTAIVGSFSLDAMVDELERAGAGAVVAFVGYVRPTSSEREDTAVERLHFEAHAPMAERAIAQIREEARAKFGLTGALVRHRVATLDAGAPIVAVATAAPHRRAAFEAAMWIMDELKTRVPIWKQEQGASGAHWVNDPAR